MSRFFTGIEIHPGAQVGRRLFIDHGMGTVIGETCRIGDNVTIYQGVTLGGTGKEEQKRHPDVDDNVRDATVVGIPGYVVKQAGEKVKNARDLNHTDLPDPILDMIHGLEDEIKDFRHEVRNEVENGSHI